LEEVEAVPGNRPFDVLRAAKVTGGLASQARHLRQLGILQGRRPPLASQFSTHNSTSAIHVKRVTRRLFGNQRVSQAADRCHNRDSSPARNRIRTEGHASQFRRNHLLDDDGWHRGREREPGLLPIENNAFAESGPPNGANLIYRGLATHIQEALQLSCEGMRLPVLVQGRIFYNRDGSVSFDTETREYFWTLPAEIVRAMPESVIQLHCLHGFRGSPNLTHNSPTVPTNSLSGKVWKGLRPISNTRNTFLTGQALHANALAKEVEGKFISAFIRANKSANELTRSAKRKPIRAHRPCEFDAIVKAHGYEAIRNR
jgi:hypothetical protein